MIPYGVKKAITSRAPLFARYESHIFLSFVWLIPGIEVSFSGELSSTLSVSLPKAEYIRSAIFGPIPLI